MLCLVTQSCPTLWDPKGCSLPGFSLHGDSPGKNTGVGCHVLFQGIFPTQGSNPCLLRSPTLAGGFITISTPWKAVRLPWVPGKPRWLVCRELSCTYRQHKRYYFSPSWLRVFKDHSCNLHLSFCISESDF